MSLIRYLSDKQIIEINNVSLGITKEQNTFHLVQPDDLRFTMRFVEQHFEENVVRKALAYCIAIITLHPFQNGNHRTSLLAAEEFLRQNHYRSSATDTEDLDLQKRRIIYEQDHDLEREFFRVTNIEDETQRIEELQIIMKSEYGQMIEQWLTKHFTQHKS
ncbi:MAG: Fic family protein [Candidatus Thermoplasmatota archaeon]|nr:Fic family protein [Candidatus Thermoplasmatota archaeon]